MAEQEKITWPSIGEEPYAGTEETLDAFSWRAQKGLLIGSELGKVVLWDTEYAHRIGFKREPVRPRPVGEAFAEGLRESIQSIVREELERRLFGLTGRIGAYAISRDFDYEEPEEEEEADSVVSIAEDEIKLALEKAFERIEFCIGNDDEIIKDHAFKIALDYLRWVFQRTDVLNITQEKLLSWVISLGNIYRKKELNDEQFKFLRDLLAVVLSGKEIPYDGYLKLFERAISCGLEETEIMKTDSGWEAE